MKTLTLTDAEAHLLIVSCIEGLKGKTAVILDPGNVTARGLESKLTMMASDLVEDR